jgi:MATE family multidrug resistance protein
MSGVAFMIPLGLSSAAAVRVGHAVGSGERARAAAAGWTAILLVVLAMALSGLTFVLIPEQLVGAFSTNALVLSLGTSLLFLAAVFQLFDGIQVVITGTLRGLGDTRTAMIVTLVAHWLVGLPVGYVLCFAMGFGVRGLWVGLTVGLILAGVILFYIWTVTIRHYQAAA